MKGTCRRGPHIDHPVWMLPFGNKWFWWAQTEIDNRSGWPCVCMGVETPPSTSCFFPFHMKHSSQSQQTVSEMGYWCVLCLLHLESLRALPRQSSVPILATMHCNLQVHLLWQVLTLCANKQAGSRRFRYGISIHSLQDDPTALTCTWQSNSKWGRKGTAMKFSLPKMCGNLVQEHRPAQKLITSRIWCPALWCTSTTAAQM